MYEDQSIEVFVVEDDPAYLKFLEYVLGLNPDLQVSFFESGQEILNQIHKTPDIVTLDYSLPDMSGTDVLRQIKDVNPDIPVIIISGQEEIGTAVELLKLGAFDYITKDEETKDRLLNAINNARRNVTLVKEIDHLKEEIAEKYDFEKNIIGASPALKKVFKLMEKATKTNITVSISGETGTGKEVVAKAIHYSSDRKKHPFVPVNITAIPNELLESELFGHEKGAFTGAHTRRIGKFEEAQKGTIFLDEIGDLDMTLQAKLLRVLQEKEVTRIGSNEILSLDIRVIVATHKDLAKEVQKGRFREDLYYRLLGLPIPLPPLRDRANDVILLARHFLREFAKDNEVSATKIGSSAKEKLMKYGFPGNVRELRSVIELAAVMAEGEEIGAEDLTFGSVQREESLFNEDMTLREYTNKILRTYLDRYDNNVLKVADVLDVGKSTIYRYLKETDQA